MGRGKSTRQLLQLMPLDSAVAPAENLLLHLPLFAGGVVELSCDGDIATLRLYDAERSLQDTATTPHPYLRGWLLDMEEITTPNNTFARLGHFEFAREDGDITLCAYIGHGVETTHLGTVASWEALHDFLNAARSHGLF